MTHVTDQAASAAFMLATLGNLRTAESDTVFMSHGVRTDTTGLGTFKTANDYPKNHPQRETHKATNNSFREQLRNSSGGRLSEQCTKLLVTDDNTDIHYTPQDMLAAGLLEFYFDRVKRQIVYYEGNQAFLTEKKNGWKLNF